MVVSALTASTIAKSRRKVSSAMWILSELEYEQTWAPASSLPESFPEDQEHRITNAEPWQKGHLSLNRSDDNLLWAGSQQCAARDPLHYLKTCSQSGRRITTSV